MTEALEAARRILSVDYGMVVEDDARFVARALVSATSEVEMLKVELREEREAVLELQQEACNRAGVPMPSQRSVVDRMREALEKAAGWFGDYAREHHEKAQRFERLGMYPDASVARGKGGTNAAREDACLAALSPPPKGE